MVLCYTDRRTGQLTVVLVSHAAMVFMKVSLFIPVRQSRFLPGMVLRMAGKYMKQGCRELALYTGDPGMVFLIVLVGDVLGQPYVIGEMEAGDAANLLI